MKIIMYVTNKDGDGFTSEVGRFDSIEEIQIRTGMFSNDVVISFEYAKDDEPDSN